MKKVIRIEFELKSPQEVVIFGYDEDLIKKEIGSIFTPAGSGNYVINAIQVCGFREAYDYWGCARYQFLNTIDEREKICDALEGKQNKFVQAKDIQLLFDIETKQTDNRSPFSSDFDKNCGRCFNEPCTCDNKIDKTIIPNVLAREEPLGKHINTYNIKRECEVPILKITDDLGCDYAYVDRVLIKKPLIEVPVPESKEDIQERKKKEQELIKDYIEYKKEKQKEPK